MVDIIQGKLGSAVSEQGLCFFLKRPDRLWIPPSLVFRGNRMFCDDFQNFSHTNTNLICGHIILDSCPSDDGNGALYSSCLELLTLHVTVPLG
jgi:hypothetical protein